MINIDTMKAYVDTTKTFIQLSSAGLVLPLAIKVQVLSLFRPERPYRGPALAAICASWVCFLVAIGAGALYQYAAVKFVEYRQDPAATYVPRLLDSLIRKQGPGVAYGVMLVAFYGGAFLVVLYSYLSLVML